MGDSYTLSPADQAVLRRVEETVRTVRARVDAIKPLFEGLPVDPLKSVEFKKFLEDHLNELSMSFVVLGRYALEPAENAPVATDSDPKTAHLRAAGFAISSAAPGAPTPSAEALDPALRASPAAQAALAAGANLLDDRNDDDDGAPPRREQTT